jgi:7-carboxy-7-deazaguanine synthase
MRVSEIYLSVQGEGPNVGFPTVFVRFGGCNLRCPLWPCDTPYAIFPEYRKEWAQKTWLQVYEDIVKAAGDMRFYNVCFTGGEPFLQNGESLRQLYETLHESLGVLAIEAFTNGTLAYPDWVAEPGCEQEFVIDWKLPGSGEHETGFNVRLENIKKVPQLNLSVKFTIADRADYEYAKELYHLHLNDMPIEIFAGVVWGKLENQELVKWILEDGMPWKLNVQVHNHVWDRTQRGI